MPPYTIRFREKAQIVELGGGGSPKFHPNIDVISGPTVDVVTDFNKPLPLHDESYDGVFSQYAIEHIEWRNVKNFIHELYRILRDGGKAVVITANTLEQCKKVVEQGVDNGTVELLFGSQEFPDHGGVHKTGFSHDYAKKLFLDAGFTFVKTYPHPVSKTDMIIEAHKIKEVFERQYFEDGSIGYWHYRDFATHYATARIIMKATDPPPESVLDVGGARGYVTRILENNGVRSVCMDISKHAWHNRATDSFILHDIRKMPWPVKNKSFDMTFSINTLEHIEEEHLDNVIKEMARVSNRGIHGIHFTESPFEELDEDLDITHRTICSKSWWEEKFKTVAPEYTVYLVHPRMLEYEEPEKQPPITFMPPSPDNLIKLNIGSFKDCFYDGWINIDIIDLKQFAEDQAYEFLQHDVRKGIPFENVDIIMSNHMIEHITREEGKRFLDECYKVLKPGGIIRISTPDAKFISKEYVEGRIWDYKFNLGVEQAADEAEAYYNLLLEGHLTIFDEESLMKLLEKAGFKEIKKASPFESRSETIKKQSISTHPSLSVILEGTR